ncbi:hypothetical protein ACKVMT_01960 [Halobacteriales archaeon Cl-PHB]
MSATAWHRLTPEPLTVAWAGLLCTTEFLLVVGYLLATDVTVTKPALYVVPFVWINLALWVFVRVRPDPGPARGHRAALGLAAGYFAILAVVGGLAGPGGSTATGLRFAVTGLPPGWGPALLYDGALLDVSLLPYKVVGYLALSYLVYVTVRDAAGALVGGIVGLLSCVSCTFPVIAAVITGVAGSGTVVASAVYANSYVLSTLAFGVTVGLLAWRPAFGNWTPAWLSR